MVLQRSPRGRTILLLASMFVTLGLLGFIRSTLVFMYAGLGLFLYYYVSKLLLETKISALNKLTVSRRHNARLDDGKELQVELLFLNETSLRLNCEVLDTYPSLFRLGQGTNAALFSVPAKGYSKLSYSVSPTSIGVNHFGPVRVVMRDIAGLFFYEREIPTIDWVHVTPRPSMIGRHVVLSTVLPTFSGGVASKKKGEGTDFADIRKYESGDPFRRIEWSATARTNKLMTRETHVETQLNVFILLDTTRTMAYGEAGLTKLDYSARAISSILEYLSSRGDQIGLSLIRGIAQALVIPLGRGEQQKERILRALGALDTNQSELGSEPPSQVSGWFGNIDSGQEEYQALNAAVKRSLTLGNMKGRILFFVMTDLESKVELAALKQLTEMKHEVFVISPFTPLFETHGLEGLDRAIYSINAAHQWKTRDALLRQAAKLGIQVVHVGPSDLFPNLVVRIEEMRRKGGS